MHFDLVTPCAHCPFRRKHGCRVGSARAREIGSMMLSSQGATFTCHQTARSLGHRGTEQHCAGALIFAELHGTATQPMRWAERLRIYNRDRLMRPARKQVHASVFSSLDDFIAAQREQL